MAGKSVLVEKPMGLCESETRGLIELAEERGVFLM